MAEDLRHAADLYQRLREELAATAEHRHRVALRLVLLRELLTLDGVEVDLPDEVRT